MFVRNWLFSHCWHERRCQGAGLAVTRMRFSWPLTASTLPILTCIPYRSVCRDGRTKWRGRGTVSIFSHRCEEAEPAPTLVDSPGVEKERSEVHWNTTVLCHCTVDVVARHRCNVPSVHVLSITLTRVWWRRLISIESVHGFEVIGTPLAPNDSGLHTNAGNFL